MTKTIVPLLFMVLFFPPVYIVLRYLGWCCKEEREDREDLEGKSKS